MHGMSGLAPLLISSAVGYGVCVIADKQKKKDFRVVGLILGVVIIVTSLFATAGLLLKCANKAGSGMRMPKMCRVMQK